MARIVAGLGAPHSPGLPSTVTKNPAFVENALYGELRRHIRSPCMRGWRPISTARAYRTALT